MLAAYRLLSSVAYRAPVPPSGFRRSRAGRRGAPARWQAWGRDTRGPGPVVWAHGASIGEHHVLEPVIGRLVRARPDLQVVVSHTSPSVPTTQLPAGVCHRDYLPWDRPDDVAPALDAVRPALALFARSDLWPVFAGALAARGIPMAVVGATVRPGSARMGALPRALFRRLHEHIRWVGAVSADDAERWRRLGVAGPRIAVTGDPRHDRILERIGDPQPAAALRAWAAGDPVLVWGSLEPDDDAVVAAALAMLRDTVSGLRSVVVPHDPTPRRLQDLDRRLASRGLPVHRWSGSSAPAPPPDARTVLVTERGGLADCYLGADVAYVGGGFRARRLHAVAEPAAVGVPVLVGPRWADAGDAARLVAAGGAVAVDSARPLATAAGRLLTHPADRDAAGLRARGVLASGAARASAAAALRLLDDGGGATNDEG